MVLLVFTGHDTKVMQNSTKSPSKRSSIEKRMDYIIYTLFALLLFVSFISSSLGFAVMTSFNGGLVLYDSESGTPAQARTSNLNEELGQVDTILSDKQGLLTCNQMDFLKCSIAGTSYGVRASEVEACCKADGDGSRGARVMRLQTFQ
ncbi:putative phospholipid-transporting ATPase 7 [Raphanus sativus]|nr:putative phospholipid-transporting ATPase 7 [Raphanus sativus]